MVKDLDGKVAIVTGAGRGIGRAEAIALALAGAKVVVNDIGCAPTGLGRDRAPAEETADAIEQAGGEAVTDHGDVSVMADATALVQRAIDTYGRLDIVVNNAGTLLTGRIADTDEDVWDNLIRSHLRGHFCVSKQAAKAFMDQRSGRLINTSSDAGLGMVGFGGYGAAKEGITSLTRTLSQELAPYGATANIVRPRANTRMFPLAVQAGIEMGELLTDTLPEVEKAGMFANADRFKASDVGALVAYLASDAAAHITGQDFTVGGGTVCLLSAPAIQGEISFTDGDVGEHFGDLFRSSAIATDHRGLRPR